MLADVKVPHQKNVKEPKQPYCPYYRQDIGSGKKLLFIFHSLTPFWGRSSAFPLPYL